MSKKHKYEFDFEGLGTCVECTIWINGKPAVVIGSQSPDDNQETLKIIKKLQKELK